MFEEVTKDFGAIINKINQRFNTNFATFEHTEENVRKVFEARGFHAGYSNRREEVKPLLRKEFDEEFEKPDTFKLLVSKAEAMYQQFKLLA